MTERHFTPFEVELSGMRLIEAGAGTGKTWTLAALVLRLLLEARCPIDKILVVTYTRAATAELAGRIRARIHEALTAFEAGHSNDAYLRALLERFSPADAQPRLKLALESFDEAAIFTIHGFCQRALGEMALDVAQPFERELIPDESALLEEVARDAWRREMATASSLWAQTLMTALGGPQGLAAKVLRHLGRAPLEIAKPAPVELSLTEERLLASWQQARALWLSDREALRAWLLDAKLHGKSYPEKKIAAVCDAASAWFAADLPLLPAPAALEWLTRHKLKQGLTQRSPAPEHAFFAAMDALWAAIGDYQAVADTALRAFCADFLLTARSQLAQRKQVRGLQSYDDLLNLFAAALDGAAGGRLIEHLRARFRIALVDEFQDTDLLQLRIFTRIFGTQTHPLIFVGDPKQAIYGFRGADVFAYLRAREQADAIHALLENRRSDRPLLDALNALFARPRPFLLDKLSYEPALAAPQEERTRCVIDDEAAPLTLWLMEPPAGKKQLTKEAGRRMAAEAVAADIARLLNLAAAGRARLGERALCGGDIAVLVRQHREGELVKQALARRGIPSVSGGEGSVWESEEAEELERLLIAIAQPSRETLVRAALASALLGADAAQMAAWRDDDLAWSARLERFHDDHRLLHERGFIAMWRRLMRRENVVARMLARPDGERRLTNYRHLAELLQAAEQRAALDAEGLARFLSEQRRAAVSEEAQLRLESDAHLVRIVTQHAAKGLQYPIVYCPFLWVGREASADWPALAHRDGAPVLDFGSPHQDELAAAAAREAAAEELRLAYVALTRAEHRCIVVWGKANQSELSPLAWLLFGPREAVAGEPREWLRQWLANHSETEVLRSLEAQLAGAFRTLPLPTNDESAAPPIAPAGRMLAPRPFLGRIAAPWRIFSYSSLVAALDEEAGADYDALPAQGAAPAAEHCADIQDFPRGARAGSCLHALFERIDFQQPQSVGDIVAATLDEYGFAPAWRPVLERMVENVLATELHPAGLKLADVPRSATLTEMEFTFPLASQAARAGYMKGFIDLVFCAAGRWYIVDWKSNWLEDYGPQALAAAMQAHRYDLQLRIYAAALRRALAWRMPHDDWQDAFGGVFYLFLRGMKPGRADGVFFARPTPAELDALLDEALT
jgi:exodeoxyribonuclease V beta subunit